MSTKKSNTPVVDKAVNDTYEELIERNNTEPTDTDKLGYLLKYIVDRNMDIVLYIQGTLRKNPKGMDEGLKAELKDGLMKDELFHALTHSKAWRRIYYQKAYEGLKAEDMDSGGDKYYSDLLTEIYEDSKELNEIFVRLVEEQEGVVITSAKQLQELTGIDRLKWDKLSEKEAKAEAHRQMEDTFIQAMRYRYELALEKLLDEGGTYSDLLKTSPAEFHLPEGYKDEAILEAIYYSFELGDTPEMKINLRDIAEIVEAPYEVVLKASHRHSITPDK